MKVYVMITDDVSDIVDLLIVGKKSDADKLVECGSAISYEVIDVADSEDVNQIYLKYIGVG